MCSGAIAHGRVPRVLLRRALPEDGCLGSRPISYDLPRLNTISSMTAGGVSNPMPPRLAFRAFFPHQAGGARL